MAGNTADTTVALTVTTSSAGIAVLLDRYATSGAVSASGDRALSKELAEYRRWVAEDKARAVKTKNVPDAQAWLVLQRDAKALIAALG